MPVPPRGAAIELAPDWVCEALSPSTVQLDRKRKVLAYAREKVPFIWLVDAEAQTLEPYELEGGRYFIHEVWVAEDRCRVAPFQAIELNLSQWWLPKEP